MANPFDLRTVLLAKHAQHVVLIHFPIALFITGVALDLLSRGKRQSQLAGAAYLNISMAAAMVIPTVLTGVAACIAATLVIASWWLHRRSRKLGSPVLPQLRIPVELMGVAVIGLTAHLGGFLTGVNS